MKEFHYYLFVYSASNRFAGKAAAWPSLIAATDATVTGDNYVGLGMNPLKAKKPKFIDFPKKALDAQLAEKLWSLSEKLTGVHYEL
jgi:hypothetical protein